MALATAARSRQTDQVPKMTREPEWNKQPDKRRTTSWTHQDQVNGIPFLAKTLEGYNIDIKTLSYFQHTWRPSTKKNYVTHINRWALWALEKGISVLNPQIANVIKYLRLYFERWQDVHSALSCPEQMVTLLVNTT